MFVDFLTTWVLPIVFTIECRAIINIWSRSPVSFERAFFMMFVLSSSLYHKPIK